MPVGKRGTNKLRRRERHSQGGQTCHQKNFCASITTPFRPFAFIRASSSALPDTREISLIIFSQFLSLQLITASFPSAAGGARADVAHNARHARVVAREAASKRRMIHCNPSAELLAHSSALFRPGLPRRRTVHYLHDRGLLVCPQLVADVYLRVGLKARPRGDARQELSARGRLMRVRLHTARRNSTPGLSSGAHLTEMLFGSKGLN